MSRQHRTSRRLASRALACAIESLECRRLLSGGTDFDFGAVEGQAFHTDFLDGFGDYGVYSFTTTQVAIAGNSASVEPLSVAEADLDLYLYDSTGTVVLSQSAGPASFEQVDLGGLPAGTYFLVVTDFQFFGSNFPTFQISLDLPSNADDAFEDNDIPDTATGLGELADYNAFDKLSLQDDDWYTFTTTSKGAAGSAVSLEFADAAGDIDLELYNEQGTLLGTSQTADDGEEVSMQGLAAGTYFVRAYGFDGDTNPNYTLVIDAPGIADDKFEDNDTQPAATPLGTVQSSLAVGDLKLTDDDWYSFTTLGTGTSDSAVAIDFIHADGDLDMQLFDAKGTKLGISQSVGNHEEISLAGTGAGTYFVKVYGFSGATNPSYALNITAPIATLSPDAKEPNDTAAQATDLRTLSGTTNVADLSIHSATDVDYFKFTTGGDGTDANVAQISFAGANGDLALDLLDADQNILAHSDGAGDVESVSLAGRAAGTYLLRVAGNGGAINRYSLSIVAPSGSTLTPDAREANNTLATATDLRTVAGAFSIESLTIHNAADVDFYKFTTTTAGTAANFVSIAFTHAAGDLDIQLLDTNGTVLASSEGTGDGERIALDRPAGTYVLKVVGFNGATNRYSLALDAPVAGAVRPDAYEGQEPVRLTQNQTISNLSIHDPAANNNQGTTQDRFTFTTLAVGGANDRVEIRFTAAQGDLKLRLLDANQAVLATSATAGDVEAISLDGRAAGTYFVVVDPQTAGATNPAYSLSITAAFVAAAALPQWTMLVYVDGDNNLEGAAVKDVNEMEAANLPRDIQIGVLVDRAPGFDSSNGDWTDTRRGVISHDSDMSTITSNLVSVGEKAMDNPQTLIDFINWGEATLPAQHYMLVIWNHGGAAYGAAWDDTSGQNQNLTLGDISQALAGANTPVSVLGFDACLMATTETVAQFSNQVDFVVASEETEGNDGWDYTDIVHDLTPLLPADARTVASTIVQSSNDDESLSTLSSVKVKGNAVTAALAAFVQASLNSETAGDWAGIRAARDAAPHYEYKQWIDLKNFMTEVKNRVTTPAVKNAATAVITALAADLVNNHSIAAKGGTGLSIYTPAPDENIFNGYAGLSFVAATHWDQFINAMRTRAVGNPRGIALDWSESNDIRANATNLQVVSAPNLSWSGLSVGSSTDVDFFRFTTAGTGGTGDRVRISFDNAQGDLDLFLLDASGSQLAASDGATGNQETVSLSGRAAGQYFVKVVGKDGATNPAYTLLIDAPAAGGDWAENNNTREKAYALQVDAFHSGLTLTAGDVDWYTFEVGRLPEFNPLVVTALFGAAGPSGGTLTMTLRDAADNVVATSHAITGGASIDFTQFGQGAYFLNVSGTPTGASLAYSLQATHSFAQTFEPPAATLSINDVSVAEGNAGTKTMTFTVTLSAAQSGPVSVHFATVAGTADASDFAAVADTVLSFDAGQTTRTLDVTINGDTAVESDETFLVHLSGASGASIADADGQGTITNDDVAPPADTTRPTRALVVSNITRSGGANITFKVTYVDDRALKLSTIGNGDVQVTGPRGYSQLAKLVSKAVGAAPHSEVVKYSVPAPGGTWDRGDNGLYKVKMLANQVSDAAGNFSLAGQLGTFTVAIPVGRGRAAQAAVAVPAAAAARGEANRGLFASRRRITDDDVAILD